MATRTRAKVVTVKLPGGGGTGSIDLKAKTLTVGHGKPRVLCGDVTLYPEAVGGPMVIHHYGYTSTHYRAIP